jgi:hypothetical protein
MTQLRSKIEMLPIRFGHGFSRLPTRDILVPWRFFTRGKRLFADLPGSCFFCPPFRKRCVEISDVERGERLSM